MYAIGVLAALGIDTRILQRLPPSRVAEAR
jgi:hypothetical protein